MTFIVPRNNDTLQQLIWAFGVTQPAPDPSSTLEQHLDAGQFTLNLTKPLETPDPTLSQGASQTTTSSPTRSSVPEPSLETDHHFHDPILGAHGVLSFIGFMVLLPAAALIPRWGRTRSAAWFKAHWLLSVVLGIPIIVISWVLGPLAVSRRGRRHVINEHQVMLALSWSLNDAYS